ncbi:hypothetical protein, partial [Phyllobacterium endophyticum]|uniref:hypothetical protein n=1 Tax=Phyllobacterium endophyticum TaxID=1149773 RepID=UPI0011C98771
SMSSEQGRRLDSKLVCPTCKNIYLTFTHDMTPSTFIVCSTSSDYLGTWQELQEAFYAQGGGDGIFELHDGQIIRKD